MRTTLLAIALLTSGAAFAQSSDTAPAPDAAASAPIAAGSAIQQPGNENPERDAHNIAVKSAPALVPDGYNGVSGANTGGPLLDPVTGKEVTAGDTTYPACTAKVTDNCVQTYERGRKKA
jgi:hypothetical protein